MGKLIYKNDMGEEIEVRGIIDNIDGDIIILHLDRLAREADIEKMETSLSAKLEKRVVILDGKYSDVVQSIRKEVI